MDDDELKERYGPDYPERLIDDGIELVLESETRFSRLYVNHEKSVRFGVSRFMDGSATLTAAELVDEWEEWGENEQIDFCQSCYWLGEQGDFPAMVRHIMEHATGDVIGAIAGSVAACLPADEAYELLNRALDEAEIGRTSNIAQSVAETRHPEAEQCLRRHLAKAWEHESLWEEDEFLNWVAYDAKTCIQYLIDLGCDPAEFDSKVRKLAKHPCDGNRESCRDWLGSHYRWLK